MGATPPEDVRAEREVLPEVHYRLDESDPDVAVLRREDGTFVAAFSARGVTKEGVLEAAKEDYMRLLTQIYKNMDRGGAREATL